MLSIRGKVLSFIVFSLYVASCQEKSKISGEETFATGVTPASPPAKSGSAGGMIPPANPPKSQEEALCVYGLNLVNDAKKDDFSELYSAICKNGTTTELFKQLIATAYEGQGEPPLNTFRYEPGPNYVTTVSLAYAIKLPAVNPSLFGDKKPNDILQAGVEQGSSRLVGKVLGREPLPAKYTVERIKMMYDIQNANGSGIFDQRLSEINVYLPYDDYRDVTVSAEHMLEPEKNEYYHSVQNLTIGWKGEDGFSYMISLTELIIKNRIDPPRAKKTLVDLHQRIVGMLHQHMTK